MRRVEHDQIIASSQRALLASQALLAAVPGQARPARSLHVTMGCEGCGTRSDLADVVGVRAWLARHPYDCTTS